MDFPLLQRLALPVAIGTVRYPGIKIHDTWTIRLMEVLLHGGTTVGGWTARQIHEAVLTTFRLSEKTYGLNQLRYDLRKLKGIGSCNATAPATPTTSHGVAVPVAGRLANSRFHHKPDPQCCPKSKLKVAYYKADKAIQDIVELLAAA